MIGYFKNSKVERNIMWPRTVQIKIVLIYLVMKHYKAFTLLVLHAICLRSMGPFIAVLVACML